MLSRKVLDSVNMISDLPSLRTLKGCQWIGSHRIWTWQVLSKIAKSRKRNFIELKKENACYKRTITKQGFKLYSNNIWQILSTKRLILNDGWRQFYVGDFVKVTDFRC